MAAIQIAGSTYADKGGSGRTYESSRPLKEESDYLSRIADQTARLANDST